MNIVTRVGRRLRWQRIPVSGIPMKRPGPELRIGLAFALLYVLCSGLTGLAVRTWPLPILGSPDFIVDAWYALVFKIGLLLVLPLLWLRSQGYGYAEIAPGPRPRVLVLLVWYLVGLSVNASWSREIWDAAAALPAGSLAAPLALGIFLPLLMAGIPEELVYRSFLQTRFERSLGRPAAILLTAVLFAAWHVPSRYLLAHGTEGSAGDLGSVILGTGLPVFIVGLILGVLWDRYRSLLPLIALHWGIDTLPILGGLLGVQK
jgi:membrane protease YdiL (CAAX protease family)